MRRKRNAFTSYGMYFLSTIIYTHVIFQISGTITDQSGRTLSGQTTEAFYTSVAHCKPFWCDIFAKLSWENL